MQQAGGRLNGSTSQDRTNYWETVPANYLEMALWMESDRMGFLLPAMTQAKLDNQRDVVKNERRQSYENRPYGLAYETILAAMYPPEHPYSWPTIGSMADLDKASREDVAAFFRRYYHPANASLCIAGDFDPAEAKRLVAKYFGPLPAGPKVEKLKPLPVELDDEKRIRMTDRVGSVRGSTWLGPPCRCSPPTKRSWKSWPTCSPAARRRGSTKSLVREKQIAQDVAGLPGLGGTRRTVLHHRHGPAGPHAWRNWRRPSRKGCSRIQTQPPTAEEIARAVHRFEAQFDPFAGIRQRFRRTGRPPQSLQRFHRRSRLPDQRLRAAPESDSRGACNAWPRSTWGRAAWCWR